MSPPAADHVEVVGYSKLRKFSYDTSLSASGTPLSLIDNSRIHRSKDN